ncbi:MAG TPA: hypothetical protein DER26_06365 [Verrucomicrobia bacterium]|nr:hypothetical protein [Verrucomicrobiota bacterium]
MARTALILGRGKSGEAAAAELRKAGYSVAFAENVDLVVASPGVPVKSELQLGVERLKARGVKLLAVTGSKGKSSVVKLVAEALGLAGRKAVACGNYGLPVCAVGDCDWAVVEVSSFQLETTALGPDAFEAAAILNLQDDHLDRHGSRAVYHALKRRLLGMTPHGILAEDLPPSPLAQGSYFDNPVLAANGAAAVALLRAAGVPDGTIRRAFAGFEPLPHRMCRVCEREGVVYVDDSKATSVAALAAGVRMAGGRVRLIAGGLPKGDDPRAACAALAGRVEKAYLVGTCAATFAAAWAGTIACEVCGTLEKAVSAARREACAGETVLLSPGAASFDQFNGFGERGERFADLVQKEGKKT